MRILAGIYRNIQVTFPVTFCMWYWYENRTKVPAWTRSNRLAALDFMYSNHSPNTGSRLGTPQNQHHPIPNCIHVEYQPLATDGGCRNLIMSFWGTSIFVSHFYVARSLNHFACPAGSRFVEASVLMCAAGATILHVGKVRISPMRIAAVTLLSGTSTKFLPILETFLQKIYTQIVSHATFEIWEVSAPAALPKQLFDVVCRLEAGQSRRAAICNEYMNCTKWLVFFCVHVFFYIQWLFSKWAQ